MNFFPALRLENLRQGCRRVRINGDRCRCRTGFGRVLLACPQPPGITAFLSIARDIQHVPAPPASVGSKEMHAAQLRTIAVIDNPYQVPDSPARTRGIPGQAEVAGIFLDPHRILQANLRPGQWLTRLCLHDLALQHPQSQAKVQAFGFLWLAGRAEVESINGFHLVVVLAPFHQAGNPQRLANFRNVPLFSIFFISGRES